MSLDTALAQPPAALFADGPSSSTSPAPMAATSFASAAARPATPLAQPNGSSVFNMNDMASSLATESALASSPASAGIDAEDPNADVDPAIIEALKSKDRLFVLRVGELMESLISERKPRIEIAPSTSYQKLLVHRCSAFYKVVLENDALSKGIIVYTSEESRVPSRRIAELVPAEATKQPAFKIMRRSTTERFRSKPTSRTGSVGGEDAELSDGEPSEGGSNGSRGNTVGNGKKILTMEEREAAYQEARSRIFMGFEEKQKENDMSASSSTFSLVSGSNSTSGGGSSSAGDLDDSISTAATESEWSGPAHRDKRDGRRNGSGANSARSSSRSLRSVHASSSRNSRAASPSFTYASIHDPPQSMGYDASQGPGQGFPAYPMQPYGYPYPPPGQAQPQHYMQQYYYPPYAYPPPQHSDPGSPTHEGLFVPPHAPHAQQMSYMPPYAWPPAPVVPQGASHSAGPSPAPGAAYSQYASAPPFAPYPMGYYPNPQPLNPHAPPHVPPMPGHAQGQGQGMYSADGHGHGHGHGQMNGASSPETHFRRPPARSATTGGQSRRQSTGPKSAWSYGPGVSMGGYPYGGMAAMSSPTSTVGTGAGENVGPRLSGQRRTSGNSNGSKTPAGDEASSVASSTSSSSRRTYTSTTSSQHPLPARPDWAVGLKAQPTLHSTHPHPRNHDHSNNHSRTMSPAQPPNGARLPHAPAVVLQSADFPPLGSSSAPAPAPVPNGAWARMMSPAGQGAQGQGPQQASYSGVLAQAQSREEDRAFERPPPKGGAELFNPKAGRSAPGEAPAPAPASAQDPAEAPAEGTEAAAVGANGGEEDAARS